MKTLNALATVAIYLGWASLGVGVLIRSIAYAYDRAMYWSDKTRWREQRKW